MGDLKNAQMVDFDDSAWTDITLPHDWAINQSFDHRLPANTGKLPWKGVGWYRKYFDLKPDQNGQQIYQPVQAQRGLTVALGLDKDDPH